MLELESVEVFKSVIQKEFPTNPSIAEEMEDWTSMQALIIVSAIDEHFDVLIEHEDLKTSNNILELYNRVKQKQRDGNS